MKRLLFIPLLLISCQPAFALDNSASGTSPKIDVERLATAIFYAEGGSRAKKPYGILSVKCDGKEHCGRICQNTIKNNLKMYAKTGRNGDSSDFIKFLGSKYAPVKKGLKNDPSGLNRNWVKNVTSLYFKWAK